MVKDVSWVEPIYWHKETVVWLKAHEDELPKEMLEDLDKVSKHNKKCQKILGK